jgi:hypothetical protein
VKAEVVSKISSNLQPQSPSFVGESRHGEQLHNAQRFYANTIVLSVHDHDFMQSRNYLLDFIKMKLYCVLFKFIIGVEIHALQKLWTPIYCLRVITISSSLIGHCAARAQYVSYEIA